MIDFRHVYSYTMNPLDNKALKFMAQQALVNNLSEMFIIEVNE